QFTSSVQQAETWRNTGDLSATIVVIATGDQARLSSLQDFEPINLASSNSNSYVGPRPPRLPPMRCSSGGGGCCGTTLTSPSVNTSTTTLPCPTMTASLRRSPAGSSLGWASSRTRCCSTTQRTR